MESSTKPALSTRCPNDIDCFIETVPDCLIIEIFLSNNVYDILTCSEVCKEWYQLCQTQYLWKIMFGHYFPSQMPKVLGLQKDRLLMKQQRMRAKKSQKKPFIYNEFWIDQFKEEWKISQGLRLTIGMDQSNEGNTIFNLSLTNLTNKRKHFDLSQWANWADESDFSTIFQAQCANPLHGTKLKLAFSSDTKLTTEDHLTKCLPFGYNLGTQFTLDPFESKTQEIGAYVAKATIPHSFASSKTQTCVGYVLGNLPNLKVYLPLGNLEKKIGYHIWTEVRADVKRPGLVLKGNGSFYTGRAISNKVIWKWNNKISNLPVNVYNQ